MRTFAFTVYGRPQPAGSKRAFAHRHSGRIVVVDDARGSRPWKQEVASAAIAALGAIPAQPVFDEAVELGVTFHLARPRSHFGSGRNATVLRASAPRFPTVRPDTTKLLRAVEDACTALLWRDDAQIVRQHVEKRYGTPERCELFVCPATELEPIVALARTASQQSIAVATTVAS